MKFVAQVTYHDFNLNESHITTTTDIIEAESEYQVYRMMVDKYYIDLITVYVYPAEFKDDPYSLRCFVVDNIYVNVCFTDDDEEIDYLSTEIRRANSVDWIVDEFQRNRDYQSVKCIRRATIDEQRVFEKSEIKFCRD